MHRKRTISDSYYAVMRNFLGYDGIASRSNNLKGAVEYRDYMRSTGIYPEVWIEYVVKTEVRQPIEEDGTIKGRKDYA